MHEDIPQRVYRLQARYPGRCVECGRRFKANTAIYWDPHRSEARHLPDQCRATARHAQAALRRMKASQ